MTTIDWGSLQHYLAQVLPPRPQEFRTMEELAQREAFPIIGPVCGNFCYQLTRTTGSRSVFELGSGFGYSTAWFARGVAKNGGGKVHHVVWDDDLSSRARGHLRALELDSFVQFTVGEAIETLERTEETFDIIFNDIDKHAYPRALDVIESKLRPGGVLIVDNVLWSGRAWDPTISDPDTEGVRELTRRVFSDPRWTASIVPIRDGLLVATWLPEQERP